MKCPLWIRLAGWVCALTLITPMARADDAAKPAAADDAPTFAATTKEPVLLRYKFKLDQVLKMAMDMDSEVKVMIQGQTIKMGQGMRIEAKIVITEIDPKGNISALTKITRMKMKITGQANVEFDSDKPEDADPAFKPVMAMINVGIPCKVSPVGEILETDLEPLRMAARRAGDAAMLKSIEESTSKMFEGTFIQLSPDPIAAGQTYKSGTVIANEKMKMHTSYKIRSVSADKTKAILDPVVEMELAPDAFPGADVKIRSQEISGWQVFDVANGYPGDAVIGGKVIIDISGQGEKGTVEMTLKNKVTSVSN